MPEVRWRWGDGTHQAPLGEPVPIAQGQPSRESFRWEPSAPNSADSSWGMGDKKTLWNLDRHSSLCYTRETPAAEALELRQWRCGSTSGWGYGFEIHPNTGDTNTWEWVRSPRQSMESSKKEARIQRLKKSELRSVSWTCSIRLLLSLDNCHPEWKLVPWGVSIKLAPKSPIFFPATTTHTKKFFRDWKKNPTSYMAEVHFNRGPLRDARPLLKKCG